MQWTQISGILDRALLMIGMYAVARGWISESDLIQLIAIVIAIAGLVWGWYVNTNKSLVQAAADIPGTTVITTPELAKATPNEKNIISSDSTKAVINAAVADGKMTTNPLGEKG